METKIQLLVAKSALKLKPSIGTNVLVNLAFSFLDWCPDLYEQLKLCYSACNSNKVVDEDEIYTRSLP